MRAWAWVVWTSHWCQNKKHLGFLIGLPRYGAEREREVGLKKRSPVMYQKRSQTLCYNNTISDSSKGCLSTLSPQCELLPLGPCPATSVFGKTVAGLGVSLPHKKQPYAWMWQDLMSLPRIFKLLNRIAYLLPCLSLSICSKNQSDAIMWSPSGMYLEALLF